MVGAGVEAVSPLATVGVDVGEPISLVTHRSDTGQTIGANIRASCVAEVGEGSHGHEHTHTLPMMQPSNPPSPHLQGFRHPYHRPTRST